MNDTFWARFDSNSANNPALNMTGDPAVEITFVNETPTGGTGDLFLDQPAGGGIDPDTVVSIGGTTYSFTFELVGTLPTTKKNGSQQVPDQFEGNAVYIITVQDYPTPGSSARLAFLPDDNATQTEMDAFGNGAIDIQNLDTSPPPSAVCFLAGTRIDTPTGPVPVERLAPGDLVLTRDAGARPVIWVGKTTLHWPGAEDDSKPIMITAKALGTGLPHRDVILSPQHRVLLSGPDVQSAFGVSEVFVPAKAMVGLPGVRQMSGRRSAEYHHVLLNDHQILMTEGLPSESFYPGPNALRALAPNLRFELMRLIPGLAAGVAEGYGALARRSFAFRKAAARLADLRRKPLLVPAAERAPEQVA
ncbi:Hint domain-containing protein [Antarctobacter jejuensis]|uniref:Hint domain-containing protein n=1 Tax=Antarctobacter jejuensis TaxID=1439938 RepID=UPI003FD0C02B